MGKYDQLYKHLYIPIATSLSFAEFDTLFCAFEFDTLFCGFEFEAAKHISLQVVPR